MYAVTPTMEPRDRSKLRVRKTRVCPMARMAMTTTLVDWRTMNRVLK